jgi:cyclin-dependent kinase 3
MNAHRKANGFETLDFLESLILGKGTYGTVYKAVDKLDGNASVAVKKLTTFPDVSCNASREIKVLKQLAQHPNIIFLRRTFMYDEADVQRNKDKAEFKINDIFLVFDFVEFDLAQLLKKFIMTEKQIRCYLFQLLTGLKYIHDHYIIHRDLKPANILVTTGNILKIADFGMSVCILPSARTVEHTSEVVTLWYRSPELCLGKKTYSNEIDLWSTG